MDSIQSAYLKSYIAPSAETGNDVVFVQRYTADRTKIGDPIQVTSDQLNASYIESTLLLSNGGFVVTYDYSDPAAAPGIYGAPIQYAASQDIAPDGSRLGGGFNVSNDPDSWTTASSHNIALSQGAYAYVLTTGMQDSDVTEKDTSLNLVDASGTTEFSMPLFHTESPPSGPYPFLVYSDVTLQHGSNATFAASYTDRVYNNDGTPSVDGQRFEYIFRDNGTLQSQSFTDFDGHREYEHYDASGHQDLSFYQYADGSRDTKYYDAATGRQTSEVLRNADGSRTLTDLAVTGKAYARQTASYDAQGALIGMTRTYADGVTQLTQSVADDGSEAIAIYDTSGRLTTRIAIASDRSRDVTLNQYAGTSKTPSFVENDHFGTGGQISSSTVGAPDGPQTQTAYAAGVTLTSHRGAADTFKASAAGGDTFVFDAGFGQDLITNFRSGVSPNTISFDTAVVTDFMHLQSHISSTDAGALIKISPTDSLLLKGVSAASLTAADFTFKTQSVA